MTHINTTINGIIYSNCTTIDSDLQPYCPLENTPYESLCVNQYHNVQLRPEHACEHTSECFRLKAELNSQNHE